jgi:hypothetical protein
MQYFQDTLSVSVVTTGTFLDFDLIDFNGAKIVATDAPVLGVAKHPCTVVGDMASVGVLGVYRLRAATAITAGQKVISNAAGGVGYSATPVNPIGNALQSAAIGEFVDVLIR